MPYVESQLCFISCVSLDNSLHSSETQLLAMPKIMRAELAIFEVFTSFKLLYQSVFLIFKLTFSNIRPKCSSPWMFSKGKFYFLLFFV